jgi:hypothetical protein
MTSINKGLGETLPKLARRKLTEDYPYLTAWTWMVRADASKGYAYSAQVPGDLVDSIDRATQTCGPSSRCSNAESNTSSTCTTN